MPPTKPIPVRLDDETLSRLDALAEAMSERTGGADISRANALRAALNVGLQALELENGLGRARQKPRPRKKQEPRNACKRPGHDRT